MEFKTHSFIHLFQLAPDILHFTYYIIKQTDFIQGRKEGAIAEKKKKRGGVVFVTVSPPAAPAPPPAAAAAAAAAPTPAGEGPIVTSGDIVLAPAEPGRPLWCTDCCVLRHPLAANSQGVVTAGGSFLTLL
jgi:hypothetical protein